MNGDYQTFVAAKLRRAQACGFDADTGAYPLFDHQHALVRWALRKGRAAIFADTGLGKTRMQLAWADQVARRSGGRVLILAPLAVAEQTCAEGAEIGVPAVHVRDGADIDSTHAICVTNYDRLHRFDPARFAAVVLDESSIIKHHDAKTLQTLLTAFRDTHYKLCCTATPAPNDWTELGTHAEFLGVCTRAEMLSEFFVHDGGETQVWRLKGHARAAFWRWVSGWGALVRSPADLGLDASRYALPPLHVEQISVETDAAPAAGELFAREAQTLSERRQARRDSLRHRVAACADLANSIDEPWVIWCELNAEGDALRAAIPDAVEIRGSDDATAKERALADFAAGRIRVLVTKPKIAGFGLNWQHCRRVGFVGVTDSFESYYQAIRRCWRFGQQREVHAYLFCSELEGAVRANLERKERDALAMAAQLSTETAAAVRDEVLGQARQSNAYDAGQPMRLPRFMQRHPAQAAAA
jgi:superfamily II DNA or RNA helicase